LTEASAHLPRLAPMSEKTGPGKKGQRDKRKSSPNPSCLKDLVSSCYSVPMPKRNIVLVLACLAALLLLTVLFPRDREPIYQGRPLSQWLHISHVKYPEDYSMSFEAKEAVRNMGTNALPLLLRWVSYEPSTLKTKLSPLLRRVPILEREFVHKPYYRADMAEMALEVLGPKAAPAIQQLKTWAITSNDERRMRHCIVVLNDIGPEALPAFISIANTETDARTYSLSIFRKFGTNGVPILVKSLTNGREEVARSAAEALGDIALLPDTVIPALTKCLQSTNAGLRLSAVRGVAGFGGAAKPAVPQLQRLAVSDSWSEIRYEAADTLRKIGAEVLDLSATSSPRDDTRGQSGEHP